MISDAVSPTSDWPGDYTRRAGGAGREGRIDGWMDEVDGDAMPFIKLPVAAATINRNAHNCSPSPTLVV